MNKKKKKFNCLISFNSANVIANRSGIERIRTSPIDCYEKTISSRYFFLIFLLFFLSSYDLLAINPKREYDATPKDVGINYITKKISVGDGSVVNSWGCLHKDLQRPFIIISGPDAGNMSNVLLQAQSLFNAGFNVILYDYRGFGGSSNFSINPLMVYHQEFVADLLAVIRSTKETYKPSKIILYGLSMGTIISRLGVEKESVHGLVLDSFVINPFLVAERIAKLKGKDLELPKSAKEYVDLNQERTDLPILIYSGIKDPFTKTDDYREFLERNKNSKLIMSECGHLESFFQNDRRATSYVREIQKFSKVI